MFREIDGIKKGPILMWPPGVVVLAAIVPLNMKCSADNAEGVLPEPPSDQFYSRLLQVFPLSIE